MSRLLIVVDGMFRRHGAQVLVEATYDYAFFQDYAAVFDRVTVAARVRATHADEGLLRADGPRVSFADLPDVQGARSVLAPWWLHNRALAAAVDAADAVCVRIPSTAGWHAASLAVRKQKPLMFELVGDPWAAGTGSLTHRLGGLVQARRVRRITQMSDVGSYVSRSHLQRTYPVRPGTVTASISSIRLPPAAFAAPRAGPAAPGRLRLIYVAMFEPYKNHRTLLDAVGMATPQDPELSLTLVGDGPLRGAIERQIRALGIGDRVRLTGHLAGRAKVEAELDAADLFVIPSWSEGLPRATIEAMARGLPVIGSTVPGNRELLPPTHQFDPADPTSALAAIRRFASPPVYRDGAERCREQANEFAADRLSARRRALLGHLRHQAGARRPGEPSGVAPAPAPVVS